MDEPKESSTEEGDPMTAGAEFPRSERYRVHNVRGSDGPCDCDDCRLELAAYNRASNQQLVDEAMYPYMESGQQ